MIEDERAEEGVLNLPGEIFASYLWAAETKKGTNQGIRNLDSTYVNERRFPQDIEEIQERAIDEGLLEKAHLDTEYSSKYSGIPKTVERMRGKGLLKRKESKKGPSTLGSYGFNVHNGSPEPGVVPVSQIAHRSLKKIAEEVLQDNPEMPRCREWQIIEHRAEKNRNAAT